jgi:L-threonylcarbamoyladenylate synthase
VRADGERGGLSVAADLVEPTDPHHRILPAYDPLGRDAPAISQAAALLRAGGLVAFPTETVYGLGANALDAAAVRRIFSAKGRPAYNPLIVHVADVAGARALVREWSPLAQALSERFWPGPLTLVLPKRPDVPDEVTAGRDSVAVRVPAHPVARALLVATGLPLAAPSANRFTELSPVTAAQVARSLGDGVGLILDGGRTGVGIESTVVDLSVSPPALLRPGTITRAQLEAITGPLADPAPVEADDAPRAAPGMIARHYAPHARVRLVASDAMVDAMHAAATRSDVRTAAVTWSDLRAGSGAALVVHHRLPPEAGAYAAELYDTLHAVDDADCHEVLVELPPDDPAWDGVRDRLTRAAHR